MLCNIAVLSSIRFNIMPCHIIRGVGVREERQGEGVMQ